MSEIGSNGEASPMVGGLSIPLAPDFSTATTQGSLQRILAQNLGRFVICEFVWGADGKETRSGVLEYVGENSLILHDDVDQNHLVCDVNPLRFVTFSTPEQQLAEEPPPSEPTDPPQENPPMAPITGIRAVSAPSQAKAAFNYTKRRSRR